VTTALFTVGLAVIAAVAWFVSAPLLAGRAAPDVRPEGDSERYRLEKEKDLAYAAIKEAEFDFQMGKLSPEDYALLRQKYEGRALAALAALERGAARRE
jgi:hypothetical protein